MARGVVKWFDATAGYGFVITDDNEGVYFRLLNKRRDADHAFSEGQYVELRVRRTDRGLEAASIKIAKPPAATAGNDDPEPRPSPPAEDNAPRAIGQYKVIRRLGQGAMGIVYLAQNSDGIEVALKQVRPDFAWNPEFLKRFAKEARHAGKVRSKYTARLIEAVTDAGRHPYLVTEFIDGPTLDDRVSQRGPLSPSETKVVAIGTAAALMAIHDAGLVHRDLKPSNVMLSQSGPCVIDFGIALSLNETSRDTRTGALLGAPAYMSPEQIRGEALTPASDIFSWASVIIFALTGHHPFETPAGNIHTLYHRITSERPNLAGIPNDFRKIVGSCLHKDPARRPSAGKLFALLTGKAGTDIKEEHFALNGIILNPGAGAIDARDRDSMLARLAAERFDVLVIGGGITGAGTALDAASRGLRVALVEARDLAAGTSSRSSRLIDGGLSYLEQGEFRLVRDAVRERDLLVARLAPHLVKPVPFLYPLYTVTGMERAYVGTGLVIYDAMEGSKRPVPHHRHLTARGALRRAPGLRPDRLTGALVYYDARVDDARLTLTVARTAAAHSAAIATRITAVKLLRGPDGARVTGARVRDEETGHEFVVNAESVVVCAGVWTDLLDEMAGVQAGYRVRISKGVHIVVPRSAVDADTGMIVRTVTGTGWFAQTRVPGFLHFIPWGEHWIVGATDTDWSGDRAEPDVTPEDIDDILMAANMVLARPLTRADVVTAYAGLQPLVVDREDSSVPTTRPSHEHVVDVPVPGLACIVGGRFTTYRLMARDAVDAAVADFAHEVPESVTHHVLLLGADGLTTTQSEARRLAEDYRVSLSVVEHLLSRYGTLAAEVLDLIRADPALARPLAAGYPYLRAEVTYAVTHENAMHVEDVLMRRTRLFIESASAGIEAAAEVSLIMGRLLGWNRRKLAAETRQYQDLILAKQTTLFSVPSLPVPSPPGTERD